MRARSLNLGVWSFRIGVVLLAFAFIAISILFRRDVPADYATGSLGSNPAQDDPFAQELVRCRAIGMAAIDDAACTTAWAENRRRFFTFASPTSPTTAPTATSGGK